MYNLARISLAYPGRRKMGKLQLDLELSDQQVNEVTVFLRTLTDKNREQYLK